MYLGDRSDYEAMMKEEDEKGLTPHRVKYDVETVIFVGATRLVAPTSFRVQYILRTDKKTANPGAPFSPAARDRLIADPGDTEWNGSVNTENNFCLLADMQL